MNWPLVRLATAADAEQIGIAQTNAWRAAYRDVLPEAVLMRDDARSRADRWRTNIESGARDVFVAVTEQGIVGHSGMGPSRDPGAGAHCGEITSLYVDPSAWRQGHGSRLISAARQHAASRGWSLLTLWVLTSNDRARQFYFSQGFRPDGVEKIEGDPPLPEVRYHL